MLALDTIAHPQITAIEQIAATLAHEVKNPLSLVTAHLKFLEQDDPTPSHRQNYQTMNRELHKINDLIMQFLTITKPASPGFFDLVYVSDLIEQTLPKYQQSYPHISFEVFNFDYTQADHVVVGSDTNLCMLLDNMLKNGIEAIENNPNQHYAGNITVFIESLGNHVELSVVDNGPGLCKSVQHHLQHSDPYAGGGINFFTTKKSGTGLGLGICTKIAQEHGGVFSIANGEEGGCVAKLVLPLAI